MVELKRHQIREVSQCVDEVLVMYGRGERKMSGFDHLLRSVKYSVKYVVRVGVFEGRNP